MIGFLEGVGVIMIRCYFIQLIEMMSKRQKRFIHTHETVFASNTRFRHPNFGIKGSIVHLVLPFSFHYCYATKIYIDILVKTRGNISKEMAKRVKRKESLDSELGGNN
jgi:hypothetical protein